MRRNFIPSKTHKNISKMLKFCVNRDIDKCKHSIEGGLIWIKTKENLQVLPKWFDGVTEKTDINFFKTDSNWKREENED